MQVMTSWEEKAQRSLIAKQLNRKLGELPENMITQSNHSGCRTRKTSRALEFSPTITDCAIVKLLDYQAHWEDLEASLNPFLNPFAIVVMAHLKTKETRKDFRARKEWKFRLTRMLYDRNRRNRCLT
jgi:hypothetical protein